MQNSKKRANTVIDPVCRMEIIPEQSKISLAYMGKPYHFCSETCLNTFKGDVHRFTGKNPGKKKGWWARYLEKLKRNEGDIRSCCR
jgi:YHS domain-containing protein